MSRTAEGTPAGTKHAESGAARAKAPLTATATKRGKLWTARMRIDGDVYHVSAAKYSRLEAALREALEAEGKQASAIRLESEYTDAAHGAAQAAREAEAAAKAAFEVRRSLVRSMKRDGLTHEDIAAIMGISHQRVSQLAAS